MRTLLFLLLCISTSFAIAQISPKAVEKNKEAEIDSLESEMMNFFQATLERNYGRKDALDLLVKGLERYHFNYLLDVDKGQLERINEKLTYTHNEAAAKVLASLWV